MSAAPFSEISRVLKPGGRLALLFRTNASQAVEDFPADVYRFPTIAEITTAMERAGLTVEKLDAAADRTSPVLITATRA